ncbi:MAG TPA: hypothetical protein VFG50_10575 [Rhodothermales bacterium]|nr:hypothetical protein [Rhodothermales bacterium]
MRADEVTAEREPLHVLALPLLIASGEQLLYTGERVVVDQGVVQALEELPRLVTPRGEPDLADVDGVLQHLQEAVAGAEEPDTYRGLLPYAAAHFFGAHGAGGHQAEGFAYERRRPVVGDDDHTAVVVVVAPVARGRRGCPSPLPDGPAHAPHDVQRTPHVVGLGGCDVDAEQHVLLGHVPVDGLLYGLALDPHLLQAPDHRQAVGGIAPEAAPVLEEEEVDGAGVGLDVGHEAGEAGALERGARLGACARAEAVVLERGDDAYVTALRVAVDELGLSP